MAAQLNETITTFFRGDSTNLVQEADKAKKAVGGLQKQLEQRAGNVKGTILDPGSLVSKAGNQLAGKLKFSAAGLGTIAAVGTLLVKTYTAANRLAGEQADKMHSMNESMRLASRTNIFASSLDGTSSLVERIKGSRDMIREATQAQRDADPYGFGQGVVGNMRNVMANTLTGAQNAAGLGPYNNFDREKDEAATLELNKRIAEQQGARLQREAARGLRDQLHLTRDRLDGSSFDLRVQDLHRERRREIQGIRGTELYTTENRRNIRLRYKEQILAERELQGFSELRHKRAMEEEGIARRLVTDEEKRVLTIQKEVEGIREQLQTGTHLTTEARQALEEQREQQRTALGMAKADLAAAQAQHKLAEDTVAIQARNTTATAKTYQTELATLDALHKQLAAYKDLNTSKAQGLQISASESENHIRQLRQDAMYGKSGGQIERQMQRDRIDRARRDRFDKHMGRTAGGLIRPERNMAGDIIGGIDPITGEYRAAAPGTGMAERGLHTGSLSDKPVGTDGSASMVRDRDPDGGLSTSGTTPAMFDGSTLFADRHTAMVNAGVVKEGNDAGTYLASHRGDPAHDPARRLADAPIFRTLAQMGATMRATPGGAEAIRATRPRFDPHNGVPRTVMQVQQNQLQTQQQMHTTLKDIFVKLDDLGLR